MKIAIISGTDRLGSNALKLAHYINKKYKELNVNSYIIDLQEFPIHAAAGGNYGKSIPDIEAFNQPILEADGVVFIIPEYNGSYPGILKLMFDYLPHPKSFDQLPVAFIGEADGAFGALRGVEQFQMVCNYRNAFVFPERVFISKVSKELEGEPGLTTPFTQKLLLQQIANFRDYVEMLSKNVDMVTLTNS